MKDVQGHIEFGKLVLLVADYLLNGFLVSGFEVMMTMVSCYAHVLMIFILAPITLLPVLTLDFFC